MSDSKPLWIVALGNPFDGMTLYGPFEDAAAALAFGEDYCGGEDWRAAALTAPALVEGPVRA